jgi:hypothetical protein
MQPYILCSSQENKRFINCNCFCFCIDKAGETIFDIGRFVLAKSAWKNRSHEVKSSKLVNGSEFPTIISNLFELIKRK